MNSRVLIVPACGDGDGLGHLRRSLSLAEEIGHGARILLPELEILEKLSSAFPGEKILSEYGDLSRFSSIIIDRRRTPYRRIVPFIDAGIPIVGIDEGGEARHYCTFLVDLLPFPAKHPANITGPEYLPLPDYHPMKTSASDRVLITFGGEDPASLTAPVTDTLIRKGFFEPEQITVVIGPLFTMTELPKGVRIIQAPEGLQSFYGNHDLVFTSFGMTAYEAAWSGIPVLLVNPSRYHRLCSRLAGFPEIGVGGIETRKLRAYVQDRERLARESSAPLPGKRSSLGEKVSSLHFSGSSGCPACEKRGNRAMERFPEKSVFLCSSCGVVYTVPVTPPKSYDSAYFFKDYKARYGKTYLEDYPALYAAAAKRTGRIMGLLARSVSAGNIPSTGSSSSDAEPSPALLDVGCAYGPFLEAARDAGFRPYGIDTAGEAVTHVRSVLNVPAAALAFEDFESVRVFRRDTYNVITMWYVVEHFRDLRNVLAKVSSLLPMGGIFAFSTPNLRGISGRKNRRAFLSASPDDHFTLWSPSWARKILADFGITVEKICITGHHPERFPGMAGIKRGMRWSVIEGTSRMLGLGDTFECYGVKR